MAVRLADHGAAAHLAAILVVAVRLVVAAVHVVSKGGEIKVD